MSKHTMFRTVGPLRSGYDPDQVDTFFAHARRAYEGDRSEPLTSTDVRRAAFDMVRGGYATASVDAALDRLERAFATRQRLVDYFDQGRPLTSEEIRQATFRRARGHGGYAEGPVDAFFDRAVEVLLGVE